MDIEADAITFSTTTAGATISGTVVTFMPTVAGLATPSVVAMDSKGAVSAPKTFAVNVTAN